jgi:hypothetical protein
MPPIGDWHSKSMHEIWINSIIVSFMPIRLTQVCQVLQDSALPEHFRKIHVSRRLNSGCDFRHTVETHHWLESAVTGLCQSDRHDLLIPYDCAQIKLRS